MRRSKVLAIVVTLGVASLAGVAAQPPPPPRGDARRPPPRFPPASAGLAARDRLAPIRPESEDQKAARGLVPNADLERAAADRKAPEGFSLEGDAAYGYLGAPATDLTGWGVRLKSGSGKDNSGEQAGSLSCTVAGIRVDEGRWFRFRIRALAQQGFKIAGNDLFMKVDFLAAEGGNSLDGLTKNLYGAIEQDRRALKSGNSFPLDDLAWRSYQLDFRLPFPEIDALRLTVGFRGGNGAGEYSDFLIDELTLERIADPAGYAPPSQAQSSPANPENLASLVPLGGRWYFDPRDGSREPPNKFDHTNADRLLYRTDRLEAPFADNMAAWLRPGYKDIAGKIVAKDRYVPDNVVVTFTKTHLIAKTKNLPNHPTAVFPDWAKAMDGNPNYIQEQDATWHIPLEPRENARHISMTANNSNFALNGGPIGIAINGVVFFNPFDAGAVEAMARLDRCCGHPNPDSQYHYHKYPVCVKTPWADDGEAHSPLIGFAFDGFPVFGPYESPGVMAKDSTDNPLNAFNVHYDEARGWHYHVTPGKFPHVLGGYWGHADPANFARGPRRPRP